MIYRGKAAETILKMEEAVHNLTNHLRSCQRCGYHQKCPEKEQLRTKMEEARQNLAEATK